MAGIVIYAAIYGYCLFVTMLLKNFSWWDMIAAKLKQEGDENVCYQSK
jgi:hypothetical protein